ncbi:hypothetical protein P3T73_16435 [Kiritimatiellota bacterium B12222]|nr:hypothetical protein P3T73_16435 [Kiritimatiellota bacterium B12222]
MNKVWLDKSGKFESIPSVWAGMGRRRNRGLRVLPKGQGYFVHVTSRTAGRAFLFGDEEKRVFVGMMRQWAEFSHLAVLTHCIMDNHVHMMLWVPGDLHLDHQQIKEKLLMVWPEPKVEAWELAYTLQVKEVQKDMDAAVLARMGDLSEFMRVLKQSFTCWYNRTHGRRGTLWDARYRSVVVDNQPLALMAVAAYIDLNPLRAGIVKDPLDYAWSGYGVAILGDESARSGLSALMRVAHGQAPLDVMRFHRKKDFYEKKVADDPGRISEGESTEKRPAPSWSNVKAFYRLWLVNKGESHAANKSLPRKARERKGMDPAQVLAEYEAMGDVPFNEHLQKKIRSFTQGVAVGSPGFLEELMRAYPDNFSQNRKCSGISPKVSQGDWMCLRELD